MRQSLYVFPPSQQFFRLRLKSSVSPNAFGPCFTRSKYFDSNHESRSLSLSTSNSTTSSDKPRWVCSKCRQTTTDLKHKFGKINDLTFYCCDDCWRQFRLQLGLGLTFRIIQIHLCFTTLWIPSPTRVFLADNDGRHGEWIAIVLLLVITVSTTVGRRASEPGICAESVFSCST
jgi:hypothetical protein